MIRILCVGLLLISPVSFPLRADEPVTAGERRGERQERRLTS